ncbi:MAG: ABC transporter substrate-binding protein [Thermodesulfobacteriota bacterium]|nr:ABC transporter substrate-binding protein [Thermodesulfobacteriota bacterium]
MKKKKISILFIFTVLIVFFLVFSHSVYAGEVRGVSDTEIKVGGIMDQTGPAADIAVQLAEAAKNYVNHINDQGGIHGRKIKYILEDDRYSIPLGIAAFKKLVFKDKIFALQGPVCIPSSRALFGQIEKLKIPDMLESPDHLAVNPVKRFIFTPIESYDEDVGVIFEYIAKELKPKDPKIAFCGFEGESAKTALRSAKKWSDFFKLKQPIHKEIIPFGVLEASSQALSMKRKGITHIIVHHSGRGTAVLLRELMKFGLNVPVFGDMITCKEDMVRLSGNASKNYSGVSAFSSWYDDNPGMKKVREITLRYRPGTETPWRGKDYCIGWLATVLLCEGMIRAGRDLTPDSWVEGMESIRNFDTQGVCAPVTYTPTNHKALDSVKFFKTDPSSGKLIPFGDWRKAPKF